MEHFKSENNITVKKKRQNIEDENDHIFSTLFGDKDFLSQESLILADFENITYYWIKIYPLRKAKKLMECNQYPSSFYKEQNDKKSQELIILTKSSSTTSL